MLHSHYLACSNSNAVHSLRLRFDPFVPHAPQCMHDHEQRIPQPRLATGSQDTSNCEAGEQDTEPENRSDRSPQISDKAETYGYSSRGAHDSKVAVSQTIIAMVKQATCIVLCPWGCLRCAGDGRTMAAPTAAAKKLSKLTSATLLRLWQTVVAARRRSSAIII